MKKVFAESFPGGQPEAKVTSITLVNNTSKTQNVSVPTDELWVLQSIKMVNVDDVARVVTCTLYKEVAKTNVIADMISASINAGVAHYWPFHTTSTNILVDPFDPLVLGPNMTLAFTWAAGGASTGGTDADGLVILVRKLPLT